MKIKDMYRKAQHSPMRVLVAVVTGVVAILVILAILGTITSKSQDVAADSRCKGSVYAYAKYNAIDLPFGDASPAEARLNCPTQYVTVETDEPDVMRREVADMMAHCWDNFGRGEIMLFSAQDEKFCVICSVFDFEDTDTQLTGLPSFMMTEDSPYTLDRRRMTYTEFIQGYRTDETVVDQARSQADMNYLDGHKRYAVMFTFFKESYWSQVRRAIWGAGIGAAAAVVVIAGVSFGIGLAGATGGIGAPVSVLIVTASVAAGGAIGAATADDSAGIVTEGNEWDANVILSEYDAQNLEALGCTALPVSQLDERFR